MRQTKLALYKIKDIVLGNREISETVVKPGNVRHDHLVALQLLTPAFLPMKVIAKFYFLDSLLRDENNHKTLVSYLVILKI